MNKSDTNIESYDEQDAFYTGTDEEYREFLDKADIEINDGEPVERTQKINLNETINIQSVIERFKKTAGGIKDTVVSKMDGLRNKKDGDAPVQKAEEKEEAKEEKAQQKAPQESEKDIAADELCEITKKLDELSQKLGMLEAKEMQRMCDHERNYSDIKRSVNEINTGVADIKQAVGSITKLNDSMFDLKNTQLNTKKVISDLNTSFTRLKKKCVLGVTVLSVLSAIIIVLQIVLMLS